jgi:uncharacterized membrane protein
MKKDHCPIDWQITLNEKRPLSNWWFHNILSICTLIFGIFLAYTNDNIVIFIVTLIFFLIYNSLNKYEDQANYENRIEKNYRDFLYAKKFVIEDKIKEEQLRLEREQRSQNGYFKKNFQKR